MIGEGSHPENVKVYGPGVEKMGLKANEPTYFTVDCSEAGQGATRSKHGTFFQRWALMLTLFDLQQAMLASG